jgi:hypothetical protein
MKWFTSSFLIAVCLVFCAPAHAQQCASAEDMQTLQQRLADQEKIINNLMGRLDMLEKAAPAKAAPAVSDAGHKVSAKYPLALHGDFRYRHELISSQGAKQRNRHRIRVRVGMDATLSDDTRAGFQIASGTGDPVSNNQTLDNGFDGKQVTFSQAYMSHGFGAATLTAGKMGNPFYVPGKSELVWDSDLNPEGLALTYRHSDSFANIGGFWIDERSGSADSLLVGAQAGHSWKNTDTGAHFTLGLGYYDYLHTKNQASFVDAADSFGNTVNAAGKYANDFNELNIFTEYGFGLSGRSAKVFADYVTNTAASAHDTGWLAGVSADTKQHHAVSYRLIYRRMEKDAVPGAYTDSDFGGGGTDSKGMELGLDYNVTKLAKASLSYFINDQGIAAGRNYNRLQLDYALKF